MKVHVYAKQIKQNTKYWSYFTRQYILKQIKISDTKVTHSNLENTIIK